MQIITKKKKKSKLEHAIEISSIDDIQKHE